MSQTKLCKQCKQKPTINHDADYCTDCFEAVFIDDDDNDDDTEQECNICGEIDGHRLGCPDDQSPFALLIRDGYD